MRGTAAVAPVWPFPFAPARRLIFSSSVSAATSSPARLSGDRDGLHHGRPAVSLHGPAAADALDGAPTTAVATRVASTAAPRSLSPRISLPPLPFADRPGRL